MSHWQSSVFHRVSVNLMFCLKVVFSNVIVDVTIFCRSFAYMHAKVSASFTNVIDMAVAAFDLVYCSLSGLWFVFVLDVSSRRLTPSDWLVFHPLIDWCSAITHLKTCPQISANCSIICNILFAVLLTSSVFNIANSFQIWSTVHVVAFGFSQWQKEKYFEWIIMYIIQWQTDKQLHGTATEYGLCTFCFCSRHFIMQTSRNKPY